MPRLYGLLIARDEADIVGQSLVHALAHCEKIVCMDNLSTDGTWEIMQDMAARHPGRVIAHRRLTEPFRDSLRALAYNDFHRELSNTDWWLRLDADEFLNEHPAGLLAHAASEQADFVRAYQMTFALTETDMAAIVRGADCRETPIEQRRRHYRVNWREFRFFRNDPTIIWDISLNPQFPQNLSKGRIASRSIFNRHYQNRDIAQIKTRIAIRGSNSAFAHVASEDWRQYIVRARDCHVWSPGAPVKSSPIVDFWLPRIKLEISQRLGRIGKPS